MSDEDQELTREEEQALRRTCSRFLTWHGLRSASDFLSEIPPDVATDVYGEGGVVEELEDEIASLLGKPAAAFLPSGVMSQQIALRVHADRRGRHTVLFHPFSHLDHHEERGYERLHGLHGRPVGEFQRLIEMDDLKGVAEPPAALLLELPQRDLGGQLPGWDDLVAQADWARGRGAAVHMDGARLWGCESFYGRTFREICEPFDTVYVSFYKQLGGLPGSGLAGPGDGVAEAPRRHGPRHVAERRVRTERAADAPPPDRRVPGACAGHRRCPAGPPGRGRCPGPAPHPDDAPRAVSGGRPAAERRPAHGPGGRHLDVGSLCAHRRAPGPARGAGRGRRHSPARPLGGRDDR